MKVSQKILVGLFLVASAPVARASAASVDAGPKDTQPPSSEGSAPAKIQPRPGAQLTYGAPGTGFAMFGGEAIAFLARDWQLGLSYGQGSNQSTVARQSVSYGKVDATTSAVDVSAKQLMVGARHFVGSSFFVGAETGYRRFDVSYDSVASFPSLSLAAVGAHSMIVVDSLVGKVKIGNQWCFNDGLLVTAEWIGYEQPLLSARSSASSTASSDSDVRQVLNEFNTRISNLLRRRGNLSSQIGFGWVF